MAYDELQRDPSQLLADFIEHSKDACWDLQFYSEWCLNHGVEADEVAEKQILLGKVGFLLVRCLWLVESRTVGKRSQTQPVLSVVVKNGAGICPTPRLAQNHAAPEPTDRPYLP